MIRDMDEYDYDLTPLDIPDLPEELNYAMTQREIQKDIMKNWKELKKELKVAELSDSAKSKILDFDKLLNYWL